MERPRGVRGESGDLHEYIRLLRNYMAGNISIEMSSCGVLRIIVRNLSTMSSNVVVQLAHS